jgi:hypothetical protein
VSVLVLALFAEGATDNRFLPVVIQRSTQKLIATRGRDTTDVLEPLIVSVSTEIRGGDERILDAARQTEGYHALIIHADADHPTRDRALTERFQPGLLLVQEEDINHHLVPLIPIRMTEAWVLADPEALLKVIGTRMTINDLGLPSHPHQIESDPDPKQTLNGVIQRATAQRGRRRKLEAADIFAPMARTISLERLQGVPAYQQFVDDITQALVALHIIE